MEFTVYKKTEEIDEKLSRGAKKKKGKGSKEASPAVESVPNTNTSGSTANTSARGAAAKRILSGSALTID